jgi:hypothetical protein
MNIERNPVPGSKIPPPLRCKDFDPVTGKRIGFACEQEQREAPVGKFNCTNKGGDLGKCNRRTFLYPRSRRKHGFHTHQGIDFYPPKKKEKGADANKPVPILSVTDGQVCCVLEWDGESSGYGNVIAVFNGRLGMTFWYAHCTKTHLRVGEPVFERQEIATVGNTGWAGDPHLHFEVHQGRSNGPPAEERTLFDAVGARLDPREVLTALGPWGMRQTFSPDGKPITPRLVADLHAEVESSREGGCFPLGANNLWHGGVHLRMPPGGDLHAPLDGHIVAVRLDPDPARAITPHGSTNFVLLRHELPAAVFERLQLAPGAPLPAEPNAPPAVGRRSSNLAADVLAVKQALHTRTNAAGLPFYDPADPGEIASDGVDAELLAAIEGFQRTLDNPYRKTPERWPDGRITVGGYTWNALLPAGRPGTDAPPDPAATAVDPARTVYTLFMHVGAVAIDPALTKRIPWLASLPAALRTRLETRGPDGMTPVVSGLSIPVTGNDVVWPAGEAPVARPDGSAPLASLVHWEVFAATQLVAAWEPAALRDETDDLTLDVPERIFDAVELTALPGFARDDFITAHEMSEFYATERAAFLRRTPCLFRSEWGLDPTAAIVSIAVMGIDTTGVAQALAPMTWWSHAADVLPPSPWVWHYNPIELLGLVQTHLDALAPTPVDPTTHGALLVRVRFDNGVVRPKAGVFLSRDGARLDGQRSYDDGTAWFRGLPPGEHTVEVDGSPLGEHRVTVAAGETTELDVITTVPGPPPPRGTLEVVVRRYTNQIAGDDVEVWLTPEGPGDVLQDLTRKGKVRFSSLPYGEYTVQAGDAASRRVSLEAKTKTVTSVLPRPRGSVVVSLRVGNGPGVGYAMELRGKGITPLRAVTDHEGKARFEALVGHYTVHVGAHHRAVRVADGEPLSYSLKLSPRHAPSPAHGTLAVQVREGTAPVVDAYVAVRDASGSFLGSQATDEHGAAIFELPPGEVLVMVEDESRFDRVDAERTTRVDVRLDG